MNKRYLAIALFFAVCACFSLFNTFRGGFDSVSMTLVIVFGFLSSLFFRNCRNR